MLSPHWPLPAFPPPNSPQGILVTSVLTILTPWAARHSTAMLITVRILEGLVQ